MSFQTETGLQISLLLPNGLAYNTSSFANFTYVTSLNTQPAGVIKLIDYESTISINSGDFITIVFSNTSDDGITPKASRFTAVIDEVLLLKTDGPNTMYEMSYTVCNKLQLQKKTQAYKGTSVDAMVSVLESYNQAHSVFPELSNICSDKMIWRLVSDDMWEQLTNIVSYSHAPGDMIFWVWDEVNNCVKISSLNKERSFDEYQVFMPTVDAVTDTANASEHSSTKNLTIHKYLSEIRANDLGKNRKSLFPNIAFSGVRDGKMQDCKIAGGCLDDTLNAMGHDIRKKALAASDLSDPKATFGDLKVIRNWPNNTHQFYSTAPTARDMKISIFAKKLTIQTYNNIGPAIGTKVGVASMILGYKTEGKLKLDPLYTDSYIVTMKTISYDPYMVNKKGGKVNAGNPITTTFVLRSDNFGENPEYVDYLIKRLGMK